PACLAFLVPFPEPSPLIIHEVARARENLRPARSFSFAAPLNDRRQSGRGRSGGRVRMAPRGSRRPGGARRVGTHRPARLPSRSPRDAWRNCPPVREHPQKAVSETAVIRGAKPFITRREKSEVPPYRTRGRPGPCRSRSFLP